MLPEHNQLQDCKGELHLSTVRGLQLNRQSHYWEAHEALEEAWLSRPGEGRRLYQGTLQAAVVYYHVRQGNYIGAVKVYRLAVCISEFLEVINETN
jgi:predicted metal-dependent hydrolase